MEPKTEKTRLSLAEAKACEARLTAAEIIVGRGGTSTITLLAKKRPVDPLEDDDGSGAVE